METVLHVPELPLLPSPVLAPPALLRLLAWQLQNGFRSLRHLHTDSWNVWLSAVHGGQESALKSAGGHMRERQSGWRLEQDRE